MSVDRRLMLIELVERLPDPGETYGETQYVIRISPRFLSKVSASDRGIVVGLLRGFCDTILASAPVWVEALTPHDFEVDWAIHRIESEGVEPASLQQRAVDLETLVRAARTKESVR